MNTYRYSAIPTSHARYLQNGGFDANGLVAEKSVSDGGGNQCRHCLEFIEGGDTMLTLSYRPFPSPQPYAESGPIFLHDKECERRADSPEMPTMYKAWNTALLRGYSSDNRIIYGTGVVVSIDKVDDAIVNLFSNPDVVYVHLRSSSNNCFQSRIERA